MTLKHSGLVGLLIVATAFAASLWLLPDLPARMPTHWDMAGNINGYMPRLWGTLLPPSIMLGALMLFMMLPRIAPKGFKLDAFIETYGAIQIAILGLLLFLHVVMLLKADGNAISLDRVMPMGIGVQLMVLGNYMGKLRKNFFMGIRTPWTLASDEVWARTHRLGGWLFVMAGVVLLVEGALLLSPMVLVATIGVAVLVPVVYSFLLYRKIEGLN